MDASAPVQGIDRSKTGVPGLDDILHGGLIKNRLYLVDGNPGAGKTTLSLQFLLQGAAEGLRCLYITLSETREELQAGAASHGWSLDGLDVVELVTDEGALDADSHLTLYHPSEVELGETMRKVLAAVERVNPSRVVLDSLSEMRLLAQSSLRYRRQILALKQFFSGRRCTVLLLDDRTSEGPDLQLQSLAHGVISLDHTAPAYGTARRQLRVIKFRGSDFRGGFHDFQIRRGGLAVFPRLVSAEHVVPFDGGQLQSGVAALDALLGGGLGRGTSTLLVGPPGTGKSTLALHYVAAAAAAGEHAAVFIFDETKNTLLTRAAALGLSITEGSGPGEILVRQVDPAELTPGAFAWLVRQAVEVNGARVVVIDSLNGYLNAMPDRQVLTAQLHELLTYLNHRGVVTFLVVAQIGTIGAMQSPVDASYLADGVIMLRFFEHGGSVKKAISVLKKRSGPHEHSIRELRFDGSGIHLSEPLMQFRGILSGTPVELKPAPAADDPDRFDGL